jgi:hypothetical protein
MKSACLLLIITALLITAGCEADPAKNLIPQQDLSTKQESIIKEAILKNDRSKLLKIGDPAVPMIIERVFEIYKSKPSRQNPVWADAANLILLLGKIKDKRAVPALDFMVENVKYRIFRGKAAHALGNIGDKRAIEPLWTAFNQEKGYLKEGHRKGPDYGWGLAGKYTEQMLEELGMALEKLGEDPGDYPKPFYSRKLR